MRQRLIGRRSARTPHPARASIEVAGNEQLFEAVRRPESAGPAIRSVDADMHVACTGALKPEAEQTRTDSASLQPRQQVHVQMRRILPGYGRGRLRRMMDHEGA